MRNPKIICWQNGARDLLLILSEFIVIAMLSVLTRKMRFKAAVFLAALYVLTVLAPHAALAFSGPGGYLHCLTQEKPAHDHVAVTVHDHADGSTHSHAGKDGAPESGDEQGPAAACCGLFSTTAMVSDTRVVLPAPLVASQNLPFPPSRFNGQGPGRIIHPPIA